jgi:hypothetical protein
MINVMKEKLAKFGVEYASRRLGLSEIEVHFKPQSFFKCDQTNASFLAEGYYIVISSDWLETANELEILKCAFHETRHAYQRACIDFPELIYHDPKVVRVWLREFDDYKRPGHGQYLNQEIEKDAIAFSDKLIEDMINENIKKGEKNAKTI